MSDDEKIACQFIMTQAKIRLQGMIALNQQRDQRGEALAYDDAAFDELETKVEAVMKRFGLPTLDDDPSEWAREGF